MLASSRRSPRRAASAIATVTLLVVVAFSLPPAGSPASSQAGVGASHPAGTPIEVAPAFHPGPGIRTLGPLANTTMVSTIVTLAPRDASGLAAEATLVSTPGSPDYRHYLTPSEIAERFAPSPSVYRAAVDYFAGPHVTVQTSPDRLFLSVRGPASSVGASFGVQFERYASASSVFYSHIAAARLPAGIPWAAALGLGNASGIRPLTSPSSAVPVVGPQATCSGAFGLLPCQIATAYNFSGFVANGTNGTGTRVGVVDVYSSAENQTNLARDLALFASGTGISVGPVNFIYPVPTNRNLNVSANPAWGLEDALDLEWARGIAPGSTIDMTLAPDASTGLYAAVDWLVAHHAVDILSMSWGEPDLGVFNAYSTPCSSECNASSDGSYTLLHPVLQAAAAEGVSVFAASGDCGAAWGTSGDSTGYPASDPWTTGVGATEVTLSSGGQYVREVGWSGNATGASSPGCQNQGGSGGGYAPFARPAWQAGPGISPTQSHRGVPDVSIQGGPSMQLTFQGQNYSVWGTSASTPMWAGMTAIADQIAGAPLGFLDPSLYAVARSGNGATAFHDITSGSNGFSAGVGWDPVTGIGSPNAAVLLPLLARPTWSPSVGSLQLLASPRFAPVGVNVTFAANATTSSPGISLVDIDFGDGNASVAPNGNASHAFAAPGVYIARAVAFDLTGNATISSPVVTVIGGGTALSVNLSASTRTLAPGASVTFTATVLGGSAPYRLTYLFGDGTYWSNTTSTTATRAYAVAGTYCAFVVATDARPLVDGGISAGVGLGVGGGSTGGCPSFAPLRVTATAGYVAADMPGDFPIQVTSLGGAPPVSTQLASDDPYVAACNCAIFRPGETTLGNHAITVYANDSFDENATARVNVTVFPSLVATFTATPVEGTTPLTVDVSASAQGGHLPDANRTGWTFGDGGTGVGAALSHTYTTAGRYTLIGQLSDQGHGNASEAFLIDVLPSGGSGGSPLSVTAQVLPATMSAAGYPMQFRAFPTGGASPYVVRWDLGQNDSAFGPTVTQTYTRVGCLAAGTCPLTVRLNVTDANGTRATATIALAPLFALRWSGLTLSETLTGSVGTTPWLLKGVARTVGVAGATVNWTWGDGNDSVGASASHTYLVPGNYTVTETAVTSWGDLLVRTHAVTVTGATLSAPTVAGGPTRSWGIAPAPMDFTAVASGGQGGPYTYAWTFGDGGTGYGPLVAHTYVHTGHFVANVTVTDQVGASRTVAYVIDVYNATVVPITVAATLDASVTHLNASIYIAPRCGPVSVPSCAAANVTLAAAWTNATDAPPLAHNITLPSVTFGATGWANVSFALPGTVDLAVYALELTANGTNYTGAALVPMPTAPGPSRGTPTRVGVIPWELLLVGGAAAAIAASAVFVGWRLYRRRRAAT